MWKWDWEAFSDSHIFGFSGPCSLSLNVTSAHLRLDHLFVPDIPATPQSRGRCRSRPLLGGSAGWVQMPTSGVAPQSGGVRNVAVGVCEGGGVVRRTGAQTERVNGGKRRESERHTGRHGWASALTFVGWGQEQGWAGGWGPDPLMVRRGGGRWGTPPPKQWLRQNDQVSPRCEAN